MRLTGSTKSWVTLTATQALSIKNRTAEGRSSHRSSTEDRLSQAGSPSGALVIALAELFQHVVASPHGKRDDRHGCGFAGGLGKMLASQI